MSELIITEKPKAAQMIASALADKGKPVKKSEGGVPYYEIKRGKESILVGCAVGHLFGVGENAVEKKKRKGWSYPVFDVEWKPAFDIDKGAAYTKKYIDVLKKLCKSASSYTVATDYDIEGETIGLNIIKYICKQKDARRMKFSTLTKEDLVEAYKNASAHLDWGQANAGITRHEMDWYWGINLSRALTASIKLAGFFKILSSGRVQGPALKIIVEREKEIKGFKSEPFWLVELKASSKNGDFIAWHEMDKFWDRATAEKVVANSEKRDGVVSSVKKEEFKQSPPFPFDLTSLQIEAYRVFRINPKETLEIAQDLYTSGFISYPRTSSQKLPPSLGYSAILKNIAKQDEYADLCNELLSLPLVPHEGKKTDPAHPAVFPTGIAPKSIDGRTKKIYDLVVRRFMATFAEPAIRQTMSIRIDINSEGFVARGTTTLFKGWQRFYGEYARMKEEELPLVNQGDPIKNNGIVLHDKETQPPKRYTPASIIKALEGKNLGTKATRSEIVDTLFKRGYVVGQSIEATDLGIKMVDTLEKFCPEIIDEELTRHFEIEMEQIQEKTKSGDDVLKEARDVLERILSVFKKKEKEIGEGLVTATKESEEKANTVGKCALCGGTLMIRKGKFGKFIACTNYPECKNTFNLPKTGLVKVTSDICTECSHPMVLMIRKSKRPQSICINPNCPSKKVTQEVSEKPCPSCKEGTVVLKSSIYGSFMACNRYPKCRYTERLK